MRFIDGKSEQQSSLFISTQEQFSMKYLGNLSTVDVCEWL